MYYAWSWWNWLFWLVPMALLIWALLGWSGRRYYGYGRRYRGPGDRDWYWDDGYGYSGPYRRRARYRGRGPRNYKRSDQRILEDVSDRLTLSDEVNASDIDVEVSDGKVCLSGTVDSRFEKREAENVADSVAGVGDVDNRLKVGRAQSGEQSVTTQWSSDRGR